MIVKIFNKVLMLIVLVLFFLVLINFIGMHNEQFVDNDDVNSNIIILNKIIESANYDKKNPLEPLSSFNL